MHTNPHRHEQEPEVSVKIRASRRRSHLTTWERYAAANLEKGGHSPEWVRRKAAGAYTILGPEFVEAARLQVWLYDHRQDGA
ncbi:MAG TPA: hypothetical protein VLT87_11040 [Thermoanaerobaculia bacterium]|nr:hypothetical protein [Thermoanaerobaculia bacterium]